MRESGRKKGRMEGRTERLRQIFSFCLQSPPTPLPSLPASSLRASLPPACRVIRKQCDEASHSVLRNNLMRETVHTLSPSEAQGQDSSQPIQPRQPTQPLRGIWLTTLPEQYRRQRIHTTGAPTPTPRSPPPPHGAARFWPPTSPDDRGTPSTLIGILGI